jgi:hypothetical protein
MNEQTMLIRCIERQEASYNPEMRAVTEPFSSPGYHTTLTAEIGNVHKTRTAAYYALALLDSGLEKYRERAYGVLDRLLEAQDVNPNNKTYGIWSWFYEEPLPMMSPPDWNWADFIGKPLLLSLKRHSKTLPAELRERIEQGVRHACRAIILRNVGPNYTNIAIMGAFVTLVAGEWLGDAEIEAYGLARLQRFYDHTMQSGTFQEFNSPNYTSIAIEELSSIRTETRSEMAKELTDQLLDVAWAMAAKRFHPRTGQWAGPHARAYTELLSIPVLSFLQHGLKGRALWLPEEAFQYHTMWYGNDIRCPDQYVPYFLESRTETLIQPLLQEHSGKERYAVTYMTEDYTVATVTHSDLWNQRRSLLAYAATQQGPVYLHLRALLDGYDYTGALLIAAQRDHSALFGVHFATDGGNRHPSLDPIRDGMITASDVRLRFELGGAVDTVEAQWQSSKDGASQQCIARLGEIPLHIEVTVAAFADEAIRYTVKREDGTVQVDVVLYEGAAKPIRLAELGRAIIAGQLAIGAAPLAMDTVMTEELCSVQMYGSSDRGELTERIVVPVRPAPLREMLEARISTFGVVEAEAKQ